MTYHFFTSTHKFTVPFIHLRVESFWWWLPKSVIIISSFIKKNVRNFLHNPPWMGNVVWSCRAWELIKIIWHFFLNLTEFESCSVVTSRTHTNAIHHFLVNLYHIFLLLLDRCSFPRSNSIWQKHTHIKDFQRFQLQIVHSNSYIF